MESQYDDRKGREQHSSISLAAPLPSVWEVFTVPEHIKHWWGPEGFTNTIEKMQVAPGGEWIFTMHGPDGTDYPNRTVFREVIWHQQLVHEHLDPNFIATIIFKQQGEHTLLTWHKLYETIELFNLVEIKYQSNKGFKQTLEKLALYVTGIAG